MAKSKKQDASTPSTAPYPTPEEQKALLDKTSDEELGKAYRTVTEARKFLIDRGIYV